MNNFSLFPPDNTIITHIFICVNKYDTYKNMCLKIEKERFFADYAWQYGASNNRKTRQCTARRWGKCLQSIHFRAEMSVYKILVLLIEISWEGWFVGDAF